MRWFLYAQNNEDDHKATRLTSISLNFCQDMRLSWKYVKPKSKPIIYKISIQKYSKPIHDFILGCKLCLLTQKGNRQCNIYWKHKFWPVSFHKIVWFTFICGNFNINADHELKKSALSEHKINWNCGLFNALVKGQ